jgi:hypothetical protein
MPRLFAGLCLALATVVSSPLLANELPGSAGPVAEARLSYINPEDLLVDSLFSQTGRVVDAFERYVSSHGLHSAEHLTFLALLADGELKQIPRPPRMVSSEAYQYQAPVGRVTPGLNLDNRLSLCGVINGREPGHCVFEKGKPTYWEEVGPVADPQAAGI